MGKNFYIADLHFGHWNIVRYDNRPFESIEEMDNALIRNWNNVVSDEDTVYILGDIS
jgi:calcineurin-like phosphoesterase family protein